MLLIGIFKESATKVTYYISVKIQSTLLIYPMFNSKMRSFGVQREPVTGQG